MHAVQRKALFTMIDSIENQLRYVKSLLLMNDGPESGREEAESRPASRAKSAAGSEYLTEAEEKALADELENARQESLKAHQARTQAEWERSRQIVDAETPGTMLG